MNNLLKISLLISAFVLFFVFSGCGEDEAKPEDFKSLEEAETALDESGEQILMIVDDVLLSLDLAKTFDGSYPEDIGLNKGGKTVRKHGLMKGNRNLSFGYNPQTGYWHLDSTVTDTEFTDIGEVVGTFVIDGQIRFTPHGLGGLPTDATNTMEYAATLSLQLAMLSLGWTTDMNFSTDFIVDGIADIRDSTGDATINGSDDLTVDAHMTFDNSNITIHYENSTKVNNVVFSPLSNYPKSGSINFTIKRDINGTGFGENFYVNGSITFDGSNIAVLEFGGYTFHINLDGSYIVEFAA